MMTYFALVDCNNFYASCERAFVPQLRKLPIVVLSNNDGCIISRSNEAKGLGIKMGVPFWEIKQLIHEHKVQVFSSNYPLYGDMSARVMDVLHQHCADVEVYSIDEAFLRLHPYQRLEDSIAQKRFHLLEWGSDLKHTVEQGTGIPVCIGIAKTKTLAKLANHVAKKKTREGTFFLNEKDEILHELPIGEVWGIGSAYRRRLNARGVNTVAQLQKVSETWMRQEFGVVGLRLLKELKGTPCYDLEPPITARKNVIVSRSFRKDIYDLALIQEALAVYATRLGEKLRKYQQATDVVTVFLIANPHKNRRLDKRTYFGKTIHLPIATSNTNDLILWAKRIASYLYEQGTNYKKAGICAERLRPVSQVQTSLFTNTQQHLRQQNVMKALDGINKKLGHNAVYMAACGQPKKRTWARKAEWQSPRYTTKWADILRVKS